MNTTAQATVWAVFFKERTIIMLEVIQHFDESLALFFQGIHNPITDLPMIMITHLGDDGIFWIILSLVLLIFKKTRKAGLMLAGALILCLAVNNLALKNIFSRERPFAVLEKIKLLIAPPSGYSFPSGHTVSSIACATTLFWNYKDSKKLAAFGAMVLAVLISFSRMYLCVHFFTDVIAGAVVGIILGAAAIFCVNFIYGKFNKA